MRAALHDLASDIAGALMATGMLILITLAVAVTMYGGIWLLSRCAPRVEAPEKAEDSP